MLEDNNLLILAGLIFMLIIFLNMKFEKFEDNIVEIINNSNNYDIPKEITKPMGNYQEFCKNLTYDAETELLTGDCENLEYTTTYDFKKPCEMLNYLTNKHHFKCDSE